MAVDLALIVPTYNEKDNLAPLIDKVSVVLEGLDWEIIFVDDDSPDQTYDAAWSISKFNPRVRCLRRVHRRGLASACIEGMLSTSASVLAVMDADLQHDESLLPKMYQTLTNDELDIVIASRYTDGGSTGDWSSSRLAMSRLATRLGQMVMVADIKDPMSGFFMLDRKLLEEVVHNLSGKGFKILLDICSTIQRPFKYKELSFTFRQRQVGESKLDTMVALEYFYLIADKTIGRFIPVRFIFFVSVGLLGSVFHLLILGMGLHVFKFSFILAQGVATYVAMSVNFVLNNKFTYKSHQLSGLSFFKGLLSFCGACSIGALINIITAQHLHQNGISWFVAGFIGAVLGGVWNFAITSHFTWKASH